jgi:hypothetical protein
MRKMDESMYELLGPARRPLDMVSNDTLRGSKF